jgi:hypothetical protein
MDTSYLRQTGRNIEGNNVLASEYSGYLHYNSLKFKFTASFTKLPIWKLEQPDQVTTSLCSLRNTDLTATNAGYIRDNERNARLP